ncbi:MAG TPA: excalibur calcium-binding domain-containing protein [Mycobacterium sp.]|nr:excalibur calcium-binding domain-containing protein [Mycobacterium sp.]
MTTPDESRGGPNREAGDPAYRPALDKDHNGIACESREPQ